MSNLPEAIETMGDEPEPLYLYKNDEVKVVGVKWLPKSDEFSFSTIVEYRTQLATYTKRTFLSGLSRMFDPLGFIGPITIRATFLLQKLWRRKIGWDEHLTEEIVPEWNKLRQDFVDLERFKLERRFLAAEASEEITYHGFCDASQKGYGACIYAVNNKRAKSAHLICAKSRVAPIKSISIPRLELCSAVLLTNLLQKTTKVVRHKPSKIFLWTDSTVVLDWLDGPPSKWQTFVANKTAKIQEWQKGKTLSGRTFPALRILLTCCQEGSRQKVY